MCCDGRRLQGPHPHHGRASAPPAVARTARVSALGGRTPSESASRSLRVRQRRSRAGPNSELATQSELCNDHQVQNPATPGSANADTRTTAVHAFDLDTEVVPIGEGTFNATVSNRWNRLLGGPLGGYLLAICLRALKRDAPLPDPVVVSAFFLRPGEAGSALIEVEAVRAGRRMATRQARLTQSGKERLLVTTTFTDLSQAEGRTESFAKPPDLPEPADCMNPLHDLPVEEPSIAQQLEFRAAKPPGWLAGKPSGRAEGKFWLRLQGERDADLVALALLVDALPLAVLELGEPGSTTLELTIHLRGHPAPGWLACRNQTRHLIGGMHEEDAEIWDSTGRLVAQSRQLATL